MKAVIPAGGFGTRVLPATKSMPKEMLPVLDKPTIQYVVEEAADAGCQDIVVITGRTKRSIEDHFDKAPELEQFLEEKGKLDLLEKVRNSSNLAKLIYLRQDWPKGLGHAVLQAAPVVEGGPFAVLLGDDIIIGDKPVTKQLVEAYEEFQAPVFGVRRVPREDVSKYGIVESEEIRPGLHKVTGIVEKPDPENAPSNLAIIGRYVFTPDILDLLRETKPGVGGEIQLADAMHAQAQQRDVYAVEFTGRRFDVGNVPGWLEANVALALQDPRFADRVRAMLDAEIGARQ